MLAVAEHDGDRTVGSAFAIKGGFLLVIILLVDRGDAERDAAFFEHAIEVDRAAVGIFRTVARTDFGAVTLELRMDDRALDHAGGITNTEEEGIGATADRDAGGVISIKRNIGDKVVARAGGGADATDAIVALGIFAAVGLVGPARRGRAAGEVAGHAADFGRGGEREEFAEVSRGGIAEKLGRDDADGGADIAEGGVDAGAGERAGGGVTDIIVFADDEGIQFHRLFGDRSRRRSGGRRRGLGEERSGQREEQSRAEAAGGVAGHRKIQEG